METPTHIQLSAHAKVNLALSVGPRETGSGLHPICSWMHAIGLADEVRLTRLQDSEPSRFLIRWANEQPVAWPLEQDLAVRAHAAIEAHAGKTLPVRLEITKSIPAGGGLGGGSSDAASLLLGLNALFDLGLAETELLEISRPLGSDIAYFLDSGVKLGRPPRPAIVQGFGDQIERLDRHTGTIMLYLPEFGCPTARVYAAYDQNPSALQEDRVRRLASKPGIPLTELFNDLEGPACLAEPRLQPMLEFLNRYPSTPGRLSGSGSTLFTLCDEGVPIDNPDDCRPLMTELI